MFDDFFQQIEKTQTKQDNDYIQDGLIYCGFCNTPKQCFVNLSGREYIMPVICQCKQKQLAIDNELEKQQKRINRISKLRETGIADKRYFNMTFDNSTEDLDFAKNYVSNWQEMYKNNLGLMLLGNKGTGKTFAAACIANALIDNGVSVYMANTTCLCDRLTRLFDDERQRIFKHIENARLLILDDFGAERGTEFVQEQIYNLVEMRYRAEKPLIITSNLTRAELKSTDLRFARTYDRLMELCHPVEINGESKRKQIANERYKKVDQLLTKPSYDWDLYKEKAQIPVYKRRGNEQIQI